MLSRFQLLDFKRRHPPAPAGTEANSYTNLILDIENNINWLKTQFPALHQFLEGHNPAEEPVEMVDGPAPGKRHQLMEPSNMDHWQAMHKDYRSEINRF